MITCISSRHKVECDMPGCEHVAFYDRDQSHFQLGWAEIHIEFIYDIDFGYMTGTGFHSSQHLALCPECQERSLGDIIAARKTALIERLRKEAEERGEFEE